MRDDVQQILGATERISGITGQLLAFTRRFANPPQQVELGMLLTAMELHMARAAGAGVTVELAGAGELAVGSGGPGPARRNYSGSDRVWERRPAGPHTRDRWLGNRTRSPSRCRRRRSSPGCMRESSSTMTDGVWTPPGV